MAAASRRLPGVERRPLILAAAGRVFGRYGYHGTTTEQVAHEAGISQPYVIRMFGSKEQLFTEVLQNARAELCALLRATIASLADEPIDTATMRDRLGTAYLELTNASGAHLVLTNGALLGEHPTIGPIVRAGFLEIWQLLREEAGLDAETALRFMADGVLINVVLGLHLPQLASSDARVAELLDATGSADAILASMRAANDA